MHHYAAQLNGLTTVGASGAIYAILLAFGMIFPENKIFVFPFPIPIKAKWFVMIYAAIELYSAMTGAGGNVAHLAHLGGMIFGFFMIRYWRRHPSKDFGNVGGSDIFGRMKDAFGRKNKTWEQSSTPHQSEQERDWEDNARRKAEQEEVDRILDKIRKSGYDSLTREEKQRLFDQSRKH